MQFGDSMSKCAAHMAALCLAEELWQNTTVDVLLHSLDR